MMNTHAQREREKEREMRERENEREKIYTVFWNRKYLFLNIQFYTFYRFSL